MSLKDTILTAEQLEAYANFGCHFCSMLWAELQYTHDDFELAIVYQL